MRAAASNEHSSECGEMQRHPAAASLLAWYDRHQRELPWRVPSQRILAGERPDPYRVWLSEIMLQQTTVEAVKPYFRRFTERWPRVGDLAAASSDDVMRAWAGLGYYSRARNLKKCAEAVVAEHDGRFPAGEAALLALPGIGPYTAAAIAAIAFGEAAPVVDGNVERVLSRFFAIAAPLPGAKPLIRERMAELMPTDRPGCFAQAVMDLGATVCTPRRPGCMVCPLHDGCAVLRHDDPERYPFKAPKAERPLRRGAAFVARRADGAILLRTRPEKGMLGAMSEPPTTGWSARQDGAVSANAAPFAADWQAAGAIAHVFTHFELRLHVYRADVAGAELPAGGWWAPAETLGEEALPTVMRKAIEAAYPGIIGPRGGMNKGKR